MLWGAVNTLLGLSALLLGRKIFGIKRRYRIVSGLLNTVSFIHGLAQITEQFLICRPLSSAWNPNTNGPCGNETVAYVIFEAVGLVLDVFIVILPIREIARLHIESKRKTGIVSLFGVGSL